jgi:hypothetical protein
MQNHAHAPQVMVDDGGVHEQSTESSACLALLASSLPTAFGTQAAPILEGLDAEAKLRRAGA